MSNVFKGSTEYHPVKLQEDLMYPKTLTLWTLYALSAASCRVVGKKNPCAFSKVTLSI